VPEYAGDLLDLHPSAVHHAPIGPAAGPEVIISGGWECTRQKQSAFFSFINEE
jgi:hypothetical protein